MGLRQIFHKIFQIALPLALGVMLLWYMYRNQNFGEIMQVAKKGVRYEILLSSLLFGLAANTVRGFRWAMLIDSLGQRIKRKNAVFAIWGNYAINMALPRVGEIWRCGAVAKYEKLSFTKLLGTLFIDRIMDTLMVTLLTICMCFFNLHFFRNFFAENPPLLIASLYALATSVWTYVVMILIALIIWIIFVKCKHFSLVQKTTGMLKNIWEGCKSLVKIRFKTQFLMQTMLIWGGYFLYFYITFFAFDFTRDLGVRIALIAFVMSSIGVAVPVQGGIGVWHFMVISTFVAFGVDKADAGAFAMIVFAVQSVWIILTGLFGIVALAVTNKEKSTE